MKNLQQYRKAQRIAVKQIGLNARTIKRIESGSKKVTVEHMEVYLHAIGFKLAYVLAELS